MTTVRKHLKDIKASSADISRAARIQDEVIDFSDIPEVSDEDFRTARKRTLTGAPVSFELRFVVYKDGSNQFRWRLTSAEGEILAIAPRGYSSKAACQKAISQIRTSQIPAYQS